jgi:hypothetical protein
MTPAFRTEADSFLQCGIVDITFGTFVCHNMFDGPKPDPYFLLDYRCFLSSAFVKVADFL